MPLASAQFSDDFESYAVGSELDGQGGWFAWNGAPSGAAVVTDNLAHEGSQSLQLASGGGSVQALGIESGFWSVRTHVFVPSGHFGVHGLALFNELDLAGTSLKAAELEFDATNDRIECDCGGYDAFVVPMIKDQWVEVGFDVDMAADRGTAYYDGEQLGHWTWSTGWDGQSEFSFIALQALLVRSYQTNGDVYFDSFVVSDVPLGDTFCIAAPNSLQEQAIISATGTRLVAAEELTLVAEPVPDQPGLFFYSASEQTLPFGNGFLCAGGGGAPIHRLPVAFAQGNRLAHDVDFSLPSAAGIVPAALLHFQAWYRDPDSGGAGFNLSNGLRITFE